MDVDLNLHSFSAPPGGDPVDFRGTTITALAVSEVSNSLSNLSVHGKISMVPIKDNFVSL